MNRIIERVQGEYHTEIMTGISCDSCGCGWGNRFTEQPCDNPQCNGTMHPYRREFERYTPGHVVVLCYCGEKVWC